MAANFDTIWLSAGAVVKGDSISTAHGWAKVNSVEHKSDHSVWMELTFTIGGDFNDKYHYIRTEQVRIKKR